MLFIEDVIPKVKLKLVLLLPDTSQTKKKRSGKSDTARGKKSAKSSKASEPQLLPLIQSLEREQEPQEAPVPSISSRNQTEQNERLVIDSEYSSLDCLPSMGLKSRVLNKMVKLSTVIDCETPLDPRQNSQDFKSSQSSIDSDNRNYSAPKVSSKTDNTVNGSARDLGSNFTVPKSVLRTDSQDTNSQESSQHSIQSLSSVSSVASLQSLPKPDFVLQPGEFDIVLCVDNAEYYGS